MNQMYMGMVNWISIPDNVEYTLYLRDEIITWKKNDWIIIKYTIIVVMYEGDNITSNNT